MTHLHLMVSWMNSGTVNWTRFSIPRRISGCCSRRRSGLHLSWMCHHCRMHSDYSVNTAGGHNRIINRLLLLIVMLLQRSQQGHRLNRAQCSTSSWPAGLHSEWIERRRQKKREEMFEIIFFFFNSQVQLYRITGFSCVSCCFVWYSWGVDSVTSTFLSDFIFVLFFHFHLDVKQLNGKRVLNVDLNLKGKTRTRPNAETSWFESVCTVLRIKRKLVVPLVKQKTNWLFFYSVFDFCQQVLHGPVNYPSVGCIDKEEKRTDPLCFQKNHGRQMESTGSSLL